MDEAVLRIILEEAQRQGATSPPSGPAAPSPPVSTSTAPNPPPQPPGQVAGSGSAAPPPAAGTTQPTQSSAIPGPGGGQPHTPISGRFAPRARPGQEFDPVEEAKKRREREEMLQQIDEAYHALYPEPEDQFDPTVEAQRQIDTKRRRADVVAEREKLDPAEKQARLDKEAKEEERRQAKIDREVAKAQRELERLQKKQERDEDYYDRQLRKEQKKQERDAERAAREQERRDPVAQARKQYEREQFNAQKKLAYEQMYGGGEEDPKSRIDKVLEVANLFRGTIGGLAGVVVGSILDTVIAVRKAQVDVQNARGGGSTGSAEVPMAGVKFQPPTADNPIPTAGVPAKPADTGAVEGLSEAASKATTSLGVFAVGLGAAVAAMSGIMKAADEAGERYGQYSATIAVAQAHADVRHTLNDLRRAHENAVDLAKYIEARSKMQEKWEDIKIKLLTDLTTVIVPVLGGLEGILSGDLNTIISGAVGAAVGSLAGPLGTIAGGITGIAMAQREMVDAARPEPKDPTTLVLDDPDAIKVPDL